MNALTFSRKSFLCAFVTINIERKRKETAVKYQTMSANVSYWLGFQNVSMLSNGALEMRKTSHRLSIAPQGNEISQFKQRRPTHHCLFDCLSAYCIELVGGSRARL